MSLILPKKGDKAIWTKPFDVDGKIIIPTTTHVPESP
jgi:hypothetical protein